MKNFLNKQVRHWRAIVFFLFTLLLFLSLEFNFANKGGPTSQLILDAGATLCVVAFVHLLDRLFLSKDIQEYVDGVKNDLNIKIGEIINASKSLEAMNKSGILRIYKSRSDASEDIRQDLINPAVSKIRLIGVSLNDFVLVDRNTPLRNAWNKIQDTLKTGQLGDPQQAIDVKVLILDPECYSAQQRLKAESSGSRQTWHRLKIDVDEVAKIMLKLKKELVNSDNSSKIKFDCRLYRPGPHLFLCWTNSVCYVEQYYFWDKRNEETPVPVIRFRQITESSDSACDFHCEMEKHFSWIWENASFSLEDYLENHSRGFDKAMFQAAATNAYLDKDAAWARIITLLKNARHNIDLQGISLHSFFDSEKKSEIPSLIERNGLKIRILFIDRMSQQAQYRSFREHILKTGDQNLSYEGYLADSEMHMQSDLCRNTHDAIQNLRRQVKTVRKSKDGDWKCPILAGEYNSAPAGFILRVDDVVLFEPYHYGKINPTGDAPTLGRDMPLFEFHEHDSRLYEEVVGRRPFGLLKDHFEFAFKNAAPVDLSSG
jgi:hypothetical protein